MRQIVREDRTPSVVGGEEGETKQQSLQAMVKVQYYRKMDGFLDLQVLHCVVLKRMLEAETEVVNVCVCVCANMHSTRCLCVSKV